MYLYIEPVDVWMFRDGRPFDAASNHHAESLYPPYPTTLQGAVRAHHLIAVLQDVNLHDPAAIEAAIGSGDRYGDLRMRGPYLARRENGGLVRYLPLPANAARIHGGCLALMPVAQQQLSTVRASAATPMVLWPQTQPLKEQTGEWITDKQLEQFWSGQIAHTIGSDQLFTREQRPGNSVDSNNGTVREGMLYEAEFIRPAEGAGLLVEVAGYAGWPTKGMLRIGGERRMASFNQVHYQEPQKVPDKLPHRFIVYFTAPTFFEQGWKPAVAPDDWSKFFTGRVKLQAAAFRRYQGVGGFDLALAKYKQPGSSGGHKLTRRYVPAGAVYYFEQVDQNIRLKTTLIQQAITDYGSEIGFGQIIIPEYEWQPTTPNIGVNHHV